MPVTPESLRAYIDGDWGTCPYCGSGDVEAGTCEADGDSAGARVDCNKCGAHWDDVFALVSVLAKDAYGQHVEPAPPAPDPKFMADYSLLLAGARKHGEDSEPDHEVGDLQQFLAAACRLLTPEQQERFWRDPDVQGVLDLDDGSYTALLDQPDGDDGG